MTWLSDGKIRREHKSFFMRNLQTGQRTILQKYWVRNSCIHLTILSISLLSFCPPFLPFYSCVLFSSVFFSSSFCFDPPWECGRVLTFSHELEGKCGSLARPEEAPEDCALTCACELEKCMTVRVLFRCSVAFLSPALLNPCYKISTEKMMREATGLQQSAITSFVKAA